MTRCKLRSWRRCILVALTVSAFSFQSLPTLAQDGDKSHIYSRPVETHPSQGEVRTVNGAMARLVTTREGAFVNFSTRELNPGHVYTLWWVVINQPEACATSPCKSPDVLKSTAKTNSDVTYGDGIVVATATEIPWELRFT